ncbi:DUF4190 domain-containing protein [Streptomyces sp. WAC06614]|uniref:DUF4190 domain-containing protein n=1 Tax=Streptomyces sp. WAC06614 TaxID=2487416 RepID=UPI000F766F20|nr:DUF4190 domain-containing protein [Streptomyces sp. WAC06614]RSS82615.1 DUF4190 domain-containing protein [Streptomyces sp. WAC06614]
MSDQNPEPHDPWAAPVPPAVDLTKGGPAHAGAAGAPGASSGAVPSDAVPPDAVPAEAVPAEAAPSDAVPDAWAAPGPGAPAGAGSGGAGGAGGADGAWRSGVSFGKADGTGSVHEQATLAGMPGAGEAPAGPQASAHYGYPGPAYPGGPAAAAQPPAGYGCPGQPGHQAPGPGPTAYPGYPGQPAQPGPTPYPGYPGQPGGYPPYGAYPGAPRNNGLGVASLVLGIISVVGCFLSFFSVLAGALAIIFGALGRGKANRGEADNGGVALAGLILGIVGVVLGLLTVLALFGLLADLGPLPDPDGPGYPAPTEHV